MKKILSILMALALTLSLAACGGGSGSQSTSEEGGMGNRLVLYSSMTENDLSNLIEGFNSVYPDIQVEVVNGSGGELTARIAAEKDNPQGDIMWGALSNSDGDTYSDLFEHWLSDHESEIMADYQSMNGFYNLDHLSTVVFCVNTELEAELGIEINGYEDLLNPALNGKIVFSDPNSSSAAWNNVANIMAAYGHGSDEAWAMIEGLLRNGLVVTTSSSVCFKAVADGEYVVGLTYEDGASTLLKSGATNIRLVYPEEGTSAFAFGCAVIKDCPNPEAAKAMINYLQSAEGQSYLGNALGTLRFTNTNAVYESPYLAPTDEVNWVTRDMDWLVENKEAVLARWNQLYTSING